MPEEMCTKFGNQDVKFLMFDFRLVFLLLALFFVQSLYIFISIILFALFSSYLDRRGLSLNMLVSIIKVKLSGNKKYRYSNAKNIRRDHLLSK